MAKIELFITTKIYTTTKLYAKDRRRLRKCKALKYNKSFWLSRSLKWQYKLKDKIFIAHKENIAVIAYCKKRIGIDIEELKDRNFNMIMDFCFNEYERHLVDTANDKMLEFYKIWTSKEAYIKFKNLDFSYIKSVGFNEILNKMDIIYFKAENFLVTILKRKKT